MKKVDIKVGGFYLAKVSDTVTTVKVLEIIDREGNTYRKGGTSYRVLNVATGRETTFRSATKFRSVAPVPGQKRETLVKTSPKPTGQRHSPIPVTHPEEEKRIDEAREAAYKKALSSQLNSTNPPHLIIIARAGTGKTTTGISALNVLKGRDPKIVPSPQQKAIWEEFLLSKGAGSIGMVAFNKSIADELKRRVPAGVDAMTLHSLGYKVVQSAFGRQQPNGWVIADTISEVEKRDLRELKKAFFDSIKATEKLVSLVKQNLIGFDGETFSVDRVTDDELFRLSAHYEVELGDVKKTFEWVRDCLERALEPKGKITFDDMIWLPVVKRLSITPYDLLFVDEAQDLNRCQQELALKAGRRLIFCGDDRQAIYGFAGADSESLKRLERTLGASNRGVKVLPLTVTRRCGKAIVEEARVIVSDFSAHESNGEGKVLRSRMKVTDDKVSEPKANLDYRSMTEDGDMVLCRVNAPLVSECFRFLKAGRKANIIGRDVGAGLISTLKKLGASDISDLSAKLSDWFAQETSKENAKRTPDESRLIALQDRYDCLNVFIEDQKTIEDVIKKIEAVFTDDKDSPGIRLSSIHRSKGLEANRVFLLEPEGKGVPHPMAKSDWAKGQEMNLRYVAITRAIEELVYVS